MKDPSLVTSYLITLTEQKVKQDEANLAAAGALESCTMVQGYLHASAWGAKRLLSRFYSLTARRCTFGGRTAGDQRTLVEGAW